MFYLLCKVNISDLENFIANCQIICEFGGARYTLAKLLNYSTPSLWSREEILAATPKHKD